MAILPGTGSYHNPRGFGVSEALKRARSPHRLGNVAIGVTLTAFIVSVCTSSLFLSIIRHDRADVVDSYSISAVKQDDFSDVVLSPTLPSSSMQNGVGTRESSR